jgi:hypothetical protein
VREREREGERNRDHVGMTWHPFDVIGSDVRLLGYGDHGATSGCPLIYVITVTSLCGQFRSSAVVEDTEGDQDDIVEEKEFAEKE